MLTRQKQTNKQKSEIKIKILGKVYVSICYYQEIYQFFHGGYDKNVHLPTRIAKCVLNYIFLVSNKKTHT